MKTFVLCTLFFVGAAALAAPNCNPQDVGYYSRQLDRACFDFENAVAQSANYYHLATDARSLSGEANRLAYSAQAGDSCNTLEFEFGYVQRVFYDLDRKNQLAQSQYPDSYLWRLYQPIVDSMNRINRAMSSGGGGTTTVTVNCNSSQYQYAECPVAGTILSAYVAQQLSSISCNQGSSWGFHDNVVWVNRGCRANFSVTIRY